MMAGTRQKLGKPGRRFEVEPENLLKLLPQKSLTTWFHAARQEYGICQTSFYRAKTEFEKLGTAIKADGGWKLPETGMFPEDPADME